VFKYLLCRRMHNQKLVKSMMQLARLSIAKRTELCIKGISKLRGRLFSDEGTTSLTRNVRETPRQGENELETSINRF
jgi:hypothetical protein